MNYIIHSAKGSSWKKHKYLSKVGNKYVYKKVEYSSNLTPGEKKVVIDGTEHTVKTANESESALFKDIEQQAFEKKIENKPEAIKKAMRFVNDFLEKHSETTYTKKK